MADLIAIGYPDETTAHAAADEARRLAAELAASTPRQSGGSRRPAHSR